MPVIACLDVYLPDITGGDVEADSCDVFQRANVQPPTPTEEHISKAELRLTDIAEAVQSNWIQLAAQLGVGPSEVSDIQADFDADVERALVMLHLWVQSRGRRATGNDLETALNIIGRADVIRRCMYNVKEVTDVSEKAVAKGYLDKTYDPLKEEIGSWNELGSSRASSYRAYSDYKSSRGSESMYYESSIESGSIDAHRKDLLQRPKDVRGTRYVDGSRSPSFYTASPAESDTEITPGKSSCCFIRW